MRIPCLLAVVALLSGQTARAASATVVDDTFAGGNSRNQNLADNSMRLRGSPAGQT